MTPDLPRIGNVLRYIYIFKNESRYRDEGIKERPVIVIDFDHACTRAAVLAIQYHPYRWSAAVSVAEKIGCAPSRILLGLSALLGHKYMVEGQPAGIAQTLGKTLLIPSPDGRIWDLLRSWIYSSPLFWTRVLLHLGPNRLQDRRCCADLAFGHLRPSSTILTTRVIRATVKPTAARTKVATK